MELQIDTNSYLIVGIIVLIGGIITIAFPRFISYIWGILAVVAGISLLVASSYLAGAIWLILGFAVIIFPRLWNVLVGIGLIMFGFLILFADLSWVKWLIGIVSIGLGAADIWVQRLANYIAAGYLLFLGIMLIVGYFAV